MGTDITTRRFFGGIYFLSCRSRATITMSMFFIVCVYERKGDGKKKNNKQTNKQTKTDRQTDRKKERKKRKKRKKEKKEKKERKKWVKSVQASSWVLNYVFLSSSFHHRGTHMVIMVTVVYFVVMDHGSKLVAVKPSLINAICDETSPNVQHIYKRVE